MSQTNSQPQQPFQQVFLGTHQQDQQQKQQQYPQLIYAQYKEQESPTSLFLQTKVNENIDFLEFASSTTALTKQAEEQLMMGVQFFQENNQNLLDLPLQTNATNSEIQKNRKQFGENRVIDITGPVTIQDGLVTSYKLYRIKTRKKNSQIYDTFVDRRFSDFEYLHSQLIQKYGGCLVPRLPQKNLWASLDLETNSYAKGRRQKLRKYLQRVLQHTKLNQSQQLHSFLYDTQSNFSLAKGQYSAARKIQDTVIQLTSSAIQSGFQLLSRYIMNTQQTQQQIKPILIKNSKEQKLAHYQVLMNEITHNVKQIKLIVSNTCEQAEIYSQINQICQNLCYQNQQQNNQWTKDFLKQYSERDSTKQVSCWQNSQSTQITFQNVNNKYENLLESYQNLLQFIQTCKQAINRRNALSEYLDQLKQQQHIEQQKQKQNPRSISLDIIRSKVLQVSRKYQQFSAELLEELNTQVSRSKSMFVNFVGQLEQVRADLYLGVADNQ